MFDTYSAAAVVEDLQAEFKPGPERGRSLKGLCQRFLQLNLAAGLQRELAEGTPG